MRIVAWNVNGRTAAWEWIEDAGVDIALLNEAHPTEERRGLWAREPVHVSKGWRSAVLTDLPIRPLTTATPTYRGKPKGTWPVFGALLPKPGAVAAAIVTLPSGEPLVTIAAYGALAEFADTSMHRIISDLADLLDDPATPDLVVIGGDFNVTTQWAGRDAAYRQRDATVFARLDALGLVDLIDRGVPQERGPLEGCRCAETACRHVRTRRDPRHPHVPWQNDYVFVSKALAARVSSVTVAATDDTFARSDHAPILVDFE